MGSQDSDNGNSAVSGAAHEEFMELCAIATTGSLEAKEWERLIAHLEKRSDCHQTLGQYESLIGTVVPRLLPIPSTVPDVEDNGSDWSLEEAEALLFACLDESSTAGNKQRRHSAPRSQVGMPQRAQLVSRSNPWTHIWWQFAAGWLLVAALGFAMHRKGLREGEEKIAEQRAAVSHRTQLTAGTGVGPPSDPQISRKDRQVAELQSQLSRELEQIAHLKAQQAEMSKQLVDAGIDEDRLNQDRRELATQLDIAGSDLGSAEKKLDVIKAQNSPDGARVSDRERKVAELTNSVRERSEEVARDEELLDHDRDIRELMGSRDLYIAEVYDVGKNGHTKEPFGRVFYTKGKSLVFYAYDLDEQQGIMSTASFQAWGGRGADQKQAVNLGIFFQDDANKKRWVLKSDESTTLAHIDAVFVTVEPYGGSARPSTKPLLFAYLRVQPNHP